MEPANPYFNGYFRNLNWRYLPYIRPIVQAYVCGNIPPKYLRILKFPHHGWTFGFHKNLKVVKASPIIPVTSRREVVTIWPDLFKKRSSWTGWWLTYPSEKYEFVEWDYYSQLNGKIKFMFQITNRWIMMNMMMSEAPIHGPGRLTHGRQAVFQKTRVAFLGGNINSYALSNWFQGLLTSTENLCVLPWKKWRLPVPSGNLT